MGRNCDIFYDYSFACEMQSDRQHGRENGK